MSSIAVPLDTLVPISRFSRGGASKEFAKVADGVPVTVLKNSEPAYFILNAHDFKELKEAEEELLSLRARDEALRREGESFSSISALLEDLHA